MKKLFVVFMLCAFSFALFAQERTVTLTIPKANTYIKYTGTAADTLNPTEQDTIDVNIYVNKDYPVQYYLNTRWDLVTAATSSVTVNVLGKVFANESYSAISTSASNAVSSSNTDIAVTSTSNPSWAYSATTLGGATYTETTTGTYTQTFTGTYYRYLKVRYIVTGPANLKLDNLELKIWERKF